jgi:lipid-binding SYLF domain-containing protein
VLAIGVTAQLLSGCTTDSIRQSERADAISEAQASYDRLIAQQPAAATLAKDAKGVLVFPNVLKAGFVLGGYHGTGALRKGDAFVARYGTTGASYGLQAGVQTYSYAMFFMRESDLAYLDSSSGWEVGVGPSITVIDQGKAASLTSTTARECVYVIFYDQKGLMAGLGIQGSKITKLD